MNFIERFFINRFLNRTRHSYFFKHHVTDALRLFVTVIDKTYYEDNEPTKQIFLRECCEDALKIYFKGEKR